MKELIQAWKEFIANAPDKYDFTFSDFMNYLISKEGDK